MQINVIVTRHPALVDYLRELGLVTEDVKILSHATAQDVADQHVAGVLPHSLSCLAATFTEIPLRLTPELRGQELDLPTIRQIASSPVTYRVERINHSCPEEARYTGCGVCPVQALCPNVP